MKHETIAAAAPRAAARRPARAVILGAVILGASCSSTPRVDRVDAGAVVDVSGRWNDTDVRQVCDTLIRDCLDSDAVAAFIAAYAADRGGARPACVVGAFANNSSEHIDTAIIARTMERAIVNSGRLDFVAGGEARAETRAERQDQQTNASEDSAAALGKETGASLILRGAVDSIVDRAGNTTVRSYFVTAELIDVETNRKLWIGENSDIKKVIKQSAYRP